MSKNLKLALKPKLASGCMTRSELEQVAASLTVELGSCVRMVQYSPTPPPDTSLPWQQTDGCGGAPIGAVRHYRNGSWDGIAGSGTTGGAAGPTGPQGPPGTIPTAILGMQAAQGSIVNNFAQLQLALSQGAQKISFHSDITLEDDIIIPYECNVTVAPYRLKQNTSARKTVLWYGYLSPIRTQIFQDFIRAEIRGPFGNGTTIPEWWGLVGTNEYDGEHDIAINCAIGANLDGTHSTNVLLAARFYWIKRIVDLRGTKSRLKGASPSSTYIYGTRNFVPDAWIYSGIFPSILPNMLSNFISVSSESLGTKIKLTTENGGCTEYYAGQTATIAGSSEASYNGNWTVDSVPAHNEVILNVTYVATATGTVKPITLDSVMETGNDSAAAMILMGADTVGGGKSFFNGIENLAVNSYYPTVTNPLKRIHCISWTDYVEEFSYVKNVAFGGFSGFGIGGEASTGVTVLNGLEISNFHGSSGMRRGALPIFAPPHGGCLIYRKGTLDMRVLQEKTRAAVGALVDGYTWEWPQFGCFLSGAHTVCEQLHVEGVGNAYHVYAHGGLGSVTLNECDHNQLMDFGMVYHGDSANQKNYKPSLAEQEANDNLGSRQAFIYHTSCGVSLGRLPVEHESGNNYNSNVVITNYRTTGTGTYLLRDWTYNVDFDGYGGRFPNALGRGNGFYTRGIPYGVPLETTISAAATHTAGVKTELTVASSAGVSPGNTVWIKSRSTGDTEYDGSFIVDSVPDGTHIVINKVWTDDMTGTLWKQGAYYNRSVPPTDKTYFIGPIW